MAKVCVCTNGIVDSLGNLIVCASLLLGMYCIANNPDLFISDCIAALKVMIDLIVFAAIWTLKIVFAASIVLAIGLLVKFRLQNNRNIS